MQRHRGSFLKPQYIVPTMFYSSENDKWCLEGRGHFCDTTCADCDVGVLTDVETTLFSRLCVRRLMWRGNCRQGLPCVSCAHVCRERDDAKESGF